MWQDKYIALTKGLNLGSADVLDGDDFQAMTNTDWDQEGTIKGRPSRATPPPFWNGGSLVASGETALGIGRLRDTASERAWLATNANLYSHEAKAHWSPRGAFACAKVDRPLNVYALPNSSTPPFPMAPDFSVASLASATPKVYDLISNNAIDQGVTGAAGSAGSDRGNGARCGTTTAMFFRRTLANNLYMVYRQAGGTTLTEVLVATDALGTATVGPVVSASFDATAFYVAYVTTTANVVRVSKVSVTGSVLATATFTQAGLEGLWLDNTNVATNKLIVSFTTAAGITFRLYDMAVSLIGVVGTFLASGGIDSGECVVGCAATGPAYWAYRSFTGTGTGDLSFGTAPLTSPGTPAQSQLLIGGGAVPNASINWGISHQPIVVGGRVYLTLIAAVASGTTGTWLTLDVTTSLYTLVARGPSDATIPWLTPQAACPTTDGAGFQFYSADYSRFSVDGSNLVGLDLRYGINLVNVQWATRSVLVGESTVFSGSVPHTIQRGVAAEFGFPFLAGQPGCDVTGASGGAVGIGSYTVAAVWRWTDETGLVHRSAPSPARTVSIPGSSINTIQVSVTNCLLSEKSTGPTPVQLEIYCTDINPTSLAPLYLQQTVAMAGGSAYTSVNITTQPVTNTEKLYTEGGAFAQYHVPADGGVAVLGRRMYLASESTVFASKLIVPGWAPGFNDEGPLQINLPPGAGRIMALEAMDEKLVVLCTRGVFVLADGGPDNIGDGPDFGTPERVSDLGIAHPRGSCWTTKGVVFVPVSSSTDPQRGGPWLLDRGASPSWIGGRILDYCQSDTPQQVCYCPERDAIFLSFDQRLRGSTTGYVLIDLRTMRWAVWTNRDAQDGAFRFFTSVNGDLWTVANEAAPLNGTPGVDAGAAGAYSMSLGTAHLYSGQTGLAWGRVRSLRVLGHPSGGAYTLTYGAVLDQFRAYSSTPVSVVAGSSGATWPSTRQVPEWRLPTQKCSSIQVTMTASPATAVWSAINLRIAPSASQAPPAQRV